MPTSTPHRIRGRIAAYDAATIDDIDRHLQRLTTSWQKLREMSPPTDKMRGDYRHDVDALLDRRNALPKTAD